MVEVLGWTGGKIAEAPSEFSESKARFEMTLSLDSDPHATLACDVEYASPWDRSCSTSITNLRVR
jgi:hypothetical protein